MTIVEKQNELVGEVVRLRQEQGLTQKQLAQLSGVKQPIIARIETKQNIPQLSTLMKLLYPLGRTLTVVPIDEK